MDKLTSGKLKELVCSNDINPSVNATLINAIYLKVQWVNKFKVR